MSDPITNITTVPDRTAPATHVINADAFLTALLTFRNEINNKLGNYSKAWCVCGVSGNIYDDFNVSSITDSGTGVITVTLETAFADANYVVLGCALDTDASWVRSTQIYGTPAVGSFVLRHSHLDGAYDPTRWLFACFGNQ